MKSTIKSVLTLSFSLLLAGACSPLASTGDKSGSDLTSLSNGPNLPEECNPCWDNFQDCFAQGNDPETCSQQIVECVNDCQAPPPPPECLHCAAGFDACATTAQANGEGVQDCAVGFEGCLSACETNTMCDDPNAQNQDFCNPEPGPNDCNACDSQFDECVNDGWGGNQDDPSGETEQCEAGWQDCWQNCQDGGDTMDEDMCQDAEQQCENNPDGDCMLPDGQEISCEDVAELCDGASDPNGPDTGCDMCEGGMDQCSPADGEDCSDWQNYCEQVCP